jgi:hypothetical protein
MREIKKIPQIKIISEYRGIGFSILIYISLPTFILFGLLITYLGIAKNSLFALFIGLMSICFMSIITYSLFYKGKYIPKKSYFFERLGKSGQNKNALIATIIVSILFLIGSFFMIKDGEVIKAIFVIIGVIGFNIANLIRLKSIKFHEDIDYEANEILAELIGLIVDEKIVASYQNFDSSKAKRKKNDNLIVVTNRKVFFAVFNGTNWMTLNKLLSEIVKIGIARNNVNSYLKLVFADNTSLGLRLDLYEKITTTPQLFVKQFLNTLDASLLGYNVVSNNNRRRVSIANENTSIAKNSGNQTRSIELNPTLVSELKTSEEIKSGRILEI